MSNNAPNKVMLMKKLKLREGRELTEIGGYGVKRELQFAENTPAVFWKKGNSYVASTKSDGGYVIFSITGLGEIRWHIQPREEGNALSKEVVEYYFGDQDVIDYFFEWVEEPEPTTDLRLLLDESGLDGGRRLLGFDDIEQEILVRGLRMVHAMMRAEVEEKIEYGMHCQSEDDWRGDPDFVHAEEWRDRAKTLLDRVIKELDPRQ